MFSIVKVDTQNKVSVIHVKNKMLTDNVLNDLVSGSAELVYLSRLPDLVMIVNENGHQLRLPINYVGSGLYGNPESAVVGDIYLASVDSKFRSPKTDVYAFDLINGLLVKSMCEKLIEEYRKANLIN